VQCSAHAALRVTVHRQATTAKPLPLPAPGRKPAPTPEQIAQMVTAELKIPVGQPDKAELAMRIVLPRPVVEHLMARAHREEYPSLAALVQTMLERAGKG
jgi:hypothetical protein